MQKTQQLSPMMQHYLKTKEEYKDCILFYRLGDFYEMFFDDALTVSRELELTLTGKDCGMEERAPMCGVPFHSASVYISKLIEKGFKVAICEQVEDPKTAKGIVKREVIRVVTPGTLIDEELLDEKNNNYLAAVFMEKGSAGVAFCDVSTGEMYTTETPDAEGALNELARYSPKEILANPEAKSVLGPKIQLRLGMKSDSNPGDFFHKQNPEEIVLLQFGNKTKEELGLSRKPLAIKATAAILGYLSHTQKSGLPYIDKLNVYDVGEYMDLDLAARRSLEITETMRDKQKRGSLLWVLDNTKTSMGARLLRQWIEKPLINPIRINERLYSVRELVDNMMLRDDLGEALSKTYDISRIISRLSLGSASPRDMLALKATAETLPQLEYLLSGTKSGLFRALSSDFDSLCDIREFLDRAIDEDAPLSVKDGGVIKLGFNEEIDKLRIAKTKGSDWLRDLESREREKTGIQKLKVGYNRVFGYYIEVLRSNTEPLPEYYVRKQTLANAERYITPELKEIENTILGASERILSLEAEEFNYIKERVCNEIDRIKRVGEIIAETDCIRSLAEAAVKNNYSMPSVDIGGAMDIKDGRHPVVEKMSKNSMFVPNDTLLDNEDNQTIIITGPNMAGKSTYMRQTALIALMAQIGSFVPASSAKLPIIDKIFTRVGASDDIASGQSTFMLEMSEVSNILKNATKNSLIILDEIGRGTSTFDGLSIAWAVAEYVHKKIGAKTLFATHYHELTTLEESLSGIKNYRIAVKKRGDDITFLRKIVRGGADDSYGIEVAALAGLPAEVITRAKNVLKKIENDETIQVKSTKKASEPTDQIGFSDKIAEEIKDRLCKMDVNTITPIEAMTTLYELINKAKEL